MSGAIFPLLHPLCFTVCTSTTVTTSFPHYTIHYYSGHIPQELQSLHNLPNALFLVHYYTVACLYNQLILTSSCYSITSSQSHIVVYNVYMCLCMYEYMCVLCMYTCMYVCIYVCIIYYLCVYVCMYACTNICMCVCVCMCVCMYVRIYECVCVFMCVCVCMYVCVYVWMYVFY